MKILAPVATGSGAHILHSELARGIDGYRLRGYSPWWTLVPPALRGFSSGPADLLHVTADYANSFRRRDCPMVATLHNYVCDVQMKPYASTAQYLHYRTNLRWHTRKSLQVADRVTAVSHYIARKVLDDLQPGCKVQVIYNGVDEQRFHPGKQRAKGAADPFRVLFCGNLSPRKRPHLLVPLANALGKTFEVHYTAGLANDALGAQRLSSDAAALIPHGRVQHVDMPGLYRQMDALFMPSLREGFGLCVAEAMACGLPIVAAAAGPMPELFEDGKGGFLRAPDDVAAYADAFRILAGSQAEALQMGEYNRSRVEQQFTLSRMIADYQALFQEVLDSPQKN